VATLKLDNLPAYLPVQLDQIGASQHGSTSITTGTTPTGSTTKGFIRKGDVLAADGDILAADGENAFGGASTYG
jgi:hypothetical protein